MTEQLDDAQGDTISLTRALSLPILALFFALLLIYTRPSPEDPNAVRWISFPETWGGDKLRYGLRNIAIVFGLSCFPGGSIGAMLGYLIAQNSKLASASISLLRIGQWAPFVIWWVLVILLFVAPDQQRGRYFFVCTMGIPAVALGTCYNFLCLRQLLRRDWRPSVFASEGHACHRALFISLVLALSVGSVNWIVVSANDNAVRHYVAATVLAFFLFVVNWLNKSGIDHSAASYREILVADLSRRGGAAYWTATLIVVSFIAVWQILNLLGYFRVSPVSVFNVTVALISGAEIWQDMWASLREIIAGIVFSGTLVLIISGTLLKNSMIRKWMLSILSVTFAIPMVLLPAWLGSAFIYNDVTWHAASVACLSFFPLLHTVWALREEPFMCKTFLAADQALPYGFAATLYGQMMMATTGLGFATVVASATVQTEKALAIFLFTLALLFALSSTLRLLARWSYYSSISRPV